MNSNDKPIPYLGFRKSGTVKERDKKMLDAKSINVKDTIEDYSDRKELTAKEKEVVLGVYEELKALNIDNFVSEVIIEKVQEKDDSIPELLIVAYAEELAAKDKK